MCEQKRENTSQIQKLTSGYENRGNTLARLGATTSIRRPSGLLLYGSCMTCDSGVEALELTAFLRTNICGSPEGIGTVM